MASLFGGGGSGLSARLLRGARLTWPLNVYIIARAAGAGTGADGSVLAPVRRHSSCGPRAPAASWESGLVQQVEREEEIDVVVDGFARPGGKGGGATGRRVTVVKKHAELVAVGAAVRRGAAVRVRADG